MYFTICNLAGTDVPNEIANVFLRLLNPSFSKRPLKFYPHNVKLHHQKAIFKVVFSKAILRNEHILRENRWTFVISNYIVKPNNKSYSGLPRLWSSKRNCHIVLTLQWCAYSSLGLMRLFHCCLNENLCEGRKIQPHQSWICPKF